MPREAVTGEAPARTWAFTGSLKRTASDTPRLDTSEGGIN